MEVVGMGTISPNNQKPKSGNQHPIQGTPLRIEIVPSRVGGS
jgi:hypothetical protein